MKHFFGLPVLLLFLLGSGCGFAANAPAETATAVVTPLPLPTTPAAATVISQKLAPVTAVPPSTITAVPTTAPTATPSATATPQLWQEPHLLGLSPLGQAIEQVQLGNGPRPFIIIAALHGGHECATSDLVRGIINRITAEPTLLPPDVTLYAIPRINPDGCSHNSRSNAHQVDLNRNWQTANWLADAEGPTGIQQGSGGTTPFSEPETSLVRDWLLEIMKRYPNQPIQVISYHAVVPQTGLVQPGYSLPGQPNPAAITLAQTYAQAAGYLYASTWVGNYTITGEFINWATDQGLVAVDVELPDKNDADTIPIGWTNTHIETNLHALLTLLAAPP